MRRYLILLLLLILKVDNTFSQWCCIDTNLIIKDKTTQTLKFQISGALLNDLASPLQGVCGVRIKFDHKFIGDLTIELLSPSGQSITLIGPVGSSGNTNLSKWNVVFVPFSQIAIPDAGFKPRWDNIQPWGILGQFFNGTYYPHKGNLEDFNQGSVNGTWTLIVKDDDLFYEGHIESFCLLFCDNSGIVCKDCSPNGGYFNVPAQSFCEGDANLNLPFLPIQPAFIPDPNTYDYQYLISKNDIIIERTKSLDFRNTPPGNYKICGISYSKVDSNAIPKTGQNYRLSTFENELTANKFGICAGLSQDCINLEIKAIPKSVDLTVSICKGSDFLIGNQSFSIAGQYDVVLPATNGCDSLVHLNLSLIDLVIQLKQPIEEINCIRSFVVIDISTSTFPTGADIKWSTLDGNFSDLTDLLRPKVNKPGTYKLIIEKGSCIDSIEYTVIQNGAIPDLEVNPDTITCLKSQVIISAKTNINTPQWNWSDGMNTISNDSDVVITKGGIYQVIVTDVNGCSNSINVSVLENKNKLIPQINVTDITCRLDTSTIFFIANRDSLSSFEWSGPNILNNSDTLIKSTAVGQYNLKLTGTNGCESNTIFNVRSVIKIPDFSCRVDTISCNQDTVYLNPIILDPLESISWQGPCIIDSSSKDQIITCPGRYNIKIKDTAGCILDTFLLVTIDTIAPDFNLNANELPCNQDSIQIFLNHNMPTSTNYKYQWSGPVGFSSKAKDPWIYERGLYKVIVTLANGCQSVDTLTVFESNDRPLIRIKSDSIDCSRDSAHILVDCPDGVLFAWSGPSNFRETKKDITVGEPGFYKLVVTSASGCTSQQSIDINKNKYSPVVGIKRNPLTCIKDSSEIVLLLQYSIDTIRWRGPNNFTSNHENIVVYDAGWYYFNSIGINGCINVDSVEIVYDTIKPIIDIITDTIDCIKTSVDLRASAPDPLTVFRWTKPNGDTSRLATLKTDVPGIHTIEATGSNGCKASSKIDVISNKKFTPLNLSADTLRCRNPISTLKSNSNDPNLNVQWILPDSKTINGKIINSKLAGKYLAKGTNQFGCVTYDSIQVVSEITIPKFNISDTSINCRIKTNPKIEVLNLNTQDSVEWTNPLNQKSYVRSISNPIIGKYVVRITDVNGCVALDSFTLKYDTLKPKIVNILIDTINCLKLTSQAKVKLNSPKITYVWSAPGFITTTDSIPVFSKAGIYSLKLEGPNFCVFDTVVQVIEDINTPIFNATADTINCARPRSRLDISLVSTDTSVNVNWFDANNNPLLGSKPVVIQGGLYKVSVQSKKNHCISFDSTFVIVDTLPPNIVASDVSLPCNSDSIQLISSSQCFGATYFWLDPHNVFFSNNQSPIARDTGIYTVIVKCNNQCTAQKQVILDNKKTYPIVFASAGNQTCRTDSVRLMSQFSPLDTMFEWSGPNQFRSKERFPIVTQSGPYNLRVTNSQGCSSDTTIIVLKDTISPAINLIQLDSLKCEQTDIRLVANPIDSSVQYTYFWNTANGLIKSGQNTNSILASGNGTYELLVENLKNGCTSNLKFNLVESFSPIKGVNLDLNLPSCTGFNNGSILISDFIGGDGPFTFSFDNKSYSRISTINNLAPGNYHLFFKDKFGCPYDTTLSISDPPLLTLDIDRDQTIKLGQSASLFGNTNADTLTLFSIQWTPNTNLSCASCINTNASPYTTTTYRLTIIDENGCKKSYDVTIKVITEPSLYIPTIFSPNGDKVNDLFNFETGLDIVKVISFEIYDRWGNGVYTLNNFVPNEGQFGWDGTLDGKNVNPGVFVYKIKVLSISGEEFTKTGDFTLLR